MEERNLLITGLVLERVLNQHDLSLIDYYWDTDSTVETTSPHKGAEEFKELLQKWLERMPDLRYELLDMIADKNKVWAWGKLQGSLNKNWMGTEAKNGIQSFDSVFMLHFKQGKILQQFNLISGHHSI